MSNIFPGIGDFSGDTVNDLGRKIVMKKVENDIKGCFKKDDDEDKGTNALSFLGDMASSAVSGGNDKGSFLGDLASSAVSGGNDKGSFLGDLASSAVSGGNDKGSFLGNITSGLGKKEESGSFVTGLFKKDDDEDKGNEGGTNALSFLGDMASSAVSGGNDKGSFLGDITSGLGKKEESGLESAFGGIKRFF